MGEQLNEILKSKATLLSEQDYRDYPAINYSSLSALDVDPITVDREFKDTPSTILGSVVDCMLTGGDYDERFITETLSRPSGKNGDLVDELLKLNEDEYLTGETIYNNNGIHILKEMLLDAYEKADINSKSMKFETAMKNFLEKGGVEYYKFLKKIGNKTVVSYEMWVTATEIVNTLRSNVYTKDYFNEFTLDEIDIKFQVPIVFNLPASVGENVEGKALIDILLINHKDKCIIPVDLKTTSSKATEFTSSFIKWRYYLQASLYSYGLNSISSYAVMPFRFLIAPTQDVYRPLVYKVSKKTLEIGRFGGSNPATGRYLKGWEQLAREFKWMRDTGNNNYPKEVYDSNGCLTLDVFDKW